MRMMAFDSLIACVEHGERSHERARCKRDRARHRDQRNAAHRAYYAENRAKLLRKKAEAYAADPEKFRARKRVANLSERQAERERARKRGKYRHAPLAGAARVLDYYHARKQATAILRDVLAIIESITA